MPDVVVNLLTLGDEAYKLIIAQGGNEREAAVAREDLEGRVRFQRFVNPPTNTMDDQAWSKHATSVPVELNVVQGKPVINVSFKLNGLTQAFPLNWRPRKP